MAKEVDISPILDDIKDKLSTLLVDGRAPVAGVFVYLPLAALPAVARVCKIRSILTSRRQAVTRTFLTLYGPEFRST
jgi:hypothetical protein